jgi:hypothetical protein
MATAQSTQSNVNMARARKRSRWYLMQGGSRTGPYRSDEIKEMVQNGLIGPDDQLWKKGLKEWMTAGDSPELFVASSNRTSQPLVGRLLAASVLGVAAILCSPWSMATESLPSSAKVVATGCAAMSFLASLGILLHAILLPFPPPCMVAVGQDAEDEDDLESTSSDSLNEGSIESIYEALDQIPIDSLPIRHATASQWSLRRIILAGVSIAVVLGVTWLLIRTPPPRKRAEGTITIAGQVVTSGKVLLADERNGRAYLAKIEKDGSFAFYSRSGGGIQDGQYNLAIMPPRPEALLTENLSTVHFPTEPEEDSMFSQYADPAATGIQVTITPVGTVRIDVSLP